MPKWSWRTTAVGVLGAFMILCTQAIAVLDSDPATNISFSEVLTALSVLGVGWFARDEVVTSRNAGAS